MSPVRRIAAGLALATVATLAIATPASAHDQLITSSPAADEQLAVAPESITMNFSGELLVLDESLTGAVVLVVDASGKDWVSGDVTVAGRTVTAPLEPGMPTAGYQVRWQVVSEDGHPIAGVVPFTVGDAEPMAAPASGGAAETPAASAEQPDQNAADSSGIVRVLLIGAGGAAAAILVLVLIRFLRRPRTAAAPPEDGGSAADDL
ncbi:copper resistance CopC family protein [Microbacterium sp.]|uniref:copper resistance CopC family protein n=1 Tax=Microbacterium sp. TaxID=51671 RepID=UPI0026158213|nr:copper resistance CopC family protein [Microbacterium sp.]MCV0333737.1 copper resistance protein CopC [Microbacterium sp.]MCV0375016.1 copper resistance protein CopC [Microbacterium sp.]MCV0388464.1 copper resistance protein CopC [Microbacterium sp.]MCV0416991.1 copper resistance protein CopC [Microbacterium sp.]MCV0420302.1 copper resistance protein CopC [Microbacterium sp.]